MYAAAGPAQIETGQGRHVLPRGRAAWIPAGTRHRSLVSDHVGASLYFSPEAVTDPSTHVTNSGREPADARNGPARDALGTWRQRDRSPRRQLPARPCPALRRMAGSGRRRLFLAQRLRESLRPDRRQTPGPVQAKSPDEARALKF
ncbi:cupin domain-containing protein [Gluconacetobacter sacchari]|uniref:hypothetical protein n=1 Tax=Gluconacetobacter sacchari TaxID=92759 RepID=UPI003571078B